MSQLKVYVHKLKKTMNVTEIAFDTEGNIKRVQAMEEGHTDALSQGWWKFEGKDLDEIAMTGRIDFNPKFQKSQQ